MSCTVSQLVDTLSALLVPYSAVPEEEYRVAQYSPRYRLAFTLLNEDAAAGNAVIGWDVPNAISRVSSLFSWTLNLSQTPLGHVSPIIDSLRVLHNFTIESQVQFHAPLGFKPRSVDGGYGLTPEDLTVFINSAEWTLCDFFHSHIPMLHRKRFFQRRACLMIQYYILSSLYPLLHRHHCLFSMRMASRALQMLSLFLNGAAL